MVNDIKPLVMVEGAKAVIVKVNSNDAELMDESLRKNIGNQIKKATKSEIGNAYQTPLIPSGV